VAAAKTFNFKYKRVDGTKYRPIISIGISFKKDLKYEVLVDSGADICIFDAEVAQAIGIVDIVTGEEMKFGGITGKSEVGYIHTVKIKIKDCEFRTKVVFSEHINDDGTGIVGQKGFFDRFVVKFDYSEKSLVLRKKDWT
jgi:hypothetical protein